MTALEPLQDWADHWAAVAVPAGASPPATACAAARV
jgi:hypothetical protein